MSETKTKEKIKKQFTLYSYRGQSKESFQNDIENKKRQGFEVTAHYLKYK